MVLLTVEPMEQMQLDAAARKRKTRSPSPASPPETPEKLPPANTGWETPDKLAPPAIKSETKQDEEAPTPTCKRAMVCDGAPHTGEACPTMAETPDIGETCLSQLVLDEGQQTDEVAVNAAGTPEIVHPPATQADTEQRNDAPIDASQPLGEALAKRASPQRVTLRSSSTTSAGNQQMWQSPARTPDDEPHGPKAGRPQSSACTTGGPESQDSIAVPVGVASNGQTDRRCDMCGDGTAELKIVGIVST